MNSASAPNGQRLLWAGFFSIFAAGVGFSVRGGILGDWAKEYGFTNAELGGITGGGLTGFGIIILIGSLILDKIGYGRLMIFAFLMHLLSAGLQMATGQIYASFGREGVYWSLFVAMFLFSIANGTCEAVVNPMVATLFPKEKTHYLNILHAGWPGGLIAGGLVSYFMNGGELLGFQPFPQKVHWLIQMSMFLVPTFLYGLLMAGARFPIPETLEHGVSVRDMMGELGLLGAAVIVPLLGLWLYKDVLPPGLSLFGLPSSLSWISWVIAGVLFALFAVTTSFRLGYLLLALLLVIHALVGYVELGTDSWISKITGSIMADPKRGLLLFVYTSGLMFALRFFAGPIEHYVSPLGLLLLSALFAMTGLYLLSGAEGIAYCVAAATVYGIGKTFFWPTMLAVVSERFPKGGAITLGAVGGVGMLSAGLLGGPGIGHKQDYFASAKLKDIAPDAYQRYAVESEKSFYGYFPVKGLDQQKIGVLEDKGADLLRVVEQDQKTSANDKGAQARAELAQWWNTRANDHADSDAAPIGVAGLYGGRQALLYTAAVPAVMAVLYLLLNLYFKAIGGYKAVQIDTSGAGVKGQGWTDEA